jgi:hypothetical protein
MLTSSRLPHLPRAQVRSQAGFYAETIFQDMEFPTRSRGRNKVRCKSLPDSQARPAELAVRGLPIGPNDLLIAATARGYDLVLVTHNTRELSRVAGLKLEDWE